MLDEIKEELADDSTSGIGLKRKFQSLLNDVIDGREIGDVSCSFSGCGKLSASAWEYNAEADNAL